MLISCLQFSNTELVEENYVLGFKQIVIIVGKLLQSLQYLKLQECEKEVYHEIIEEEITTLLTDANDCLKNQKDIEMIRQRAKNKF